jgi:hypothetical protein
MRMGEGVWVCVCVGGGGGVPPPPLAKQIVHQNVFFDESYVSDHPGNSPYEKNLPPGPCMRYSVLLFVIFDCIRCKNVWDVFHDLKNVKIAQRSVKICQFGLIWAIFYEFKSRFEKSW